MNQLDLYLLGRRLMRISERAIRGPGAPALPTSSRLVVEDLFAHPDSSITDITARSGLPQSVVSACVARLRELGVVQTASDPADGRRTLVRISEQTPRRVAERGAPPADVLIAESFGLSERDGLRDVLASLDVLVARLPRGSHARANRRPADAASIPTADAARRTQP